MAYNDSDALERQLLLQELQGRRGIAAGEPVPGTTRPPVPRPSSTGSPASTVPTAAFPYTPPSAYADLSSAGEGGGRRAAGTIASGASTGAQLGSFVPGIGTGIGAGIGAAVGGIQALAHARHNDTKDEREDFARSLGVADTTALWQKLDSSLPPAVANELKNRALNRIGRHDMAANQQWMADVQTALDGASHAPAATTPTAPTATTADSAPPDYSTYSSTVGQYAQGHGSGFDPDKVADPARGDSGKYKLARVESHFDPTKGITPEFMDALNRAGIGHFRQIDEDEVVLDDEGADPSFGRTRHFDLINKFDSGQGTWGYLQQDKGGVMGGQQRQAVSAGAPATSATIESLIPTDTNFYNRLQAKIQDILGGSSVFDRQALLKLLGAQ